jgi:hypothetical protein
MNTSWYVAYEFPSLYLWSALFFVRFADPTFPLLQNVAFLSFLLFTTLQLFFALIARSDSMMADCGTFF